MNQNISSVLETLSTAKHNDLVDYLYKEFLDLSHNSLNSKQAFEHCLKSYAAIISLKSTRPTK